MSTREGVPGVAEGRPEHLRPVWASDEAGGGQARRALTPITTVSSPLNLGMNLSPRRISASLRGRNLHITLMLHSAGSAIAAGCWEGARGWVGAGLGTPREEAANLTARG